MAFVSRKDAATELGFSRQRLEKLIKQGRVVETDHGVDLEQARQVRATMLDMRKEMAGESSPGFAPETVREAAAEDKTGKGGRKPYAVPRGARKSKDEDTGELFSFADARTKREKANASLAELRYLEASGRLIPADEVKAKEFEVGRVLRDTILGFPAKIQALIPPDAMLIMTEECEQLVRNMQEAVARIAERAPQ